MKREPRWGERALAREIPTWVWIVFALLIGLAGLLLHHHNGEPFFSGGGGGF